MDIFFYEAFREEARLIKENLPKHIKAGFAKETIQEHIKETGNKALQAKVISLRTQSKIPDAWLGGLDGILARATGYDQIKKYSPKIHCGHLPLYCNRAVAEQAMLLWMNLLRKLPVQLRQFEKFKRDGLTGRECKGKKIVIYGIGNIGYEIYKIAKGLEMKAYGVDIVENYKDVNYVAKTQGIKKADIVVSAMNLTDKNKGYFNYELLKKSKPGLIFINISRGELSPAKDILKLLDENHLSGVALDVYDNEAIIGEGLRNDKKNQPLIQEILKLNEKDNAILTPHNAFNTIESTQRKAIQSVEQIVHFIENGEFLWEIPS